MQLIAADFRLINENQDDKEIMMTTSATYKKQIRIKIRDAAYKYLNKKQLNHSKIRNIQYDTLQRKSQEVNLLHDMRSRSTECTVNFKQKYIHTNTRCTVCGDESENQQHLMKCKSYKT